MKALSLLAGLCLVGATALAQDPDLNYILKAVERTPCSQVQVLIAHDIGVVRWSRRSMRYLYGEDMRPLEETALKSGKRVIAVDRDFKIPR